MMTEPKAALTTVILENSFNAEAWGGTLPSQFDRWDLVVIVETRDSCEGTARSQGCEGGSSGDERPLCRDRPRANVESLHSA